MPSNNKRKHHGSPLHSSNGDLPLTSSSDNRQDVAPHGEISHRKHTANGKENLTVSESLPVARTSSNGAPAENSCHGETLARTSSDGVPAGNSCHGETSTSTDRGADSNGKTSSISEYGGMHSGKTLFSTGKRVNGNSKHLCSSPNCAHSGLHNRVNGDTEAIVNLKQLNKQLLQQVCSLRSDDALLHDKLKALQIQLEENSARGDALLAEKLWLENQKVNFELDLKASSQEVAKLGLEKAGLLDEKQALLGRNHELERDLLDCEEKMRETSEKLKESMKALALAEEKAHLMEADIEKLQLDQQRLNGEISSLQVHNSGIWCAMKDLKMEKESLENELRSLQDKCTIVERQVNEAKQVKEALEAKLASRSLQREGFQMQLQGAWQQIQSLEAQQEASMSEKYEPEKQIQQLVNALAGARAEHEETCCMLTLERQEKVSLQSSLHNAEGRSKGLNAELDTRSSSIAKLQTEADESRLQIVTLEAQVASLVNEKVVLEDTKASLKEKLEYLKSSSEEASVSSKNKIIMLKESVSELEKALALVKMRSIKDGKCVRDLNSEMNELSTSLKERRGLAEVSVPIAALSTGSLVVLGFLFLWKRGK